MGFSFPPFSIMSPTKDKSFGADWYLHNPSDVLIFLLPQLPIFYDKSPESGGEFWPYAAAAPSALSVLLLST